MNKQGKQITLGMIFVAVMGVLGEISVNVVSDITSNSINDWIKEPKTINLIQPSIGNQKIQEIAQQKIVIQNQQELEGEKEDYELRIINMQKISLDNDCGIQWSQKQKCYVEGRLLTEKQFEDEMKAMKSQVISINKSLKNYD